MALESFYGGKQGVSPVIKASFKYVDVIDPAYIAANRTQTTEQLKPYTMNECFADVNYKDVWYNELCIIDTENKMNPENGKIFRRTLKQDGTVEGLYAEYIGQIVGPSGGTPNLVFGSLDSVRKQAVGIAPTNKNDQVLGERNQLISPNESYPLDNSNWDYAYPRSASNISQDNPRNTGLSYATGNGEGTDDINDFADDIKQIAILNSSDTENISSVPGHKTNTSWDDEANSFNDNIKYTWCNVRRTKDNSNDEAWIYLGFEIPYTTFDVERYEENYTYNGNIFIDLSNKKTNGESFDNEHPFAKRYAFHIPRGARGIGPEEIFIVNPKDSNSKIIPTGNTLYDFDAITYDQNTDTYSVNRNKTRTVSDTDSYWVAKWTLYNPKTTEKLVVYQYLGSYKDVRGVNLADNGTLTFTYSDNDTEVFNKKIKWITSITIDTTQSSNSYGTMTINYNNEDAAFTKVLPFIKAINYTDSTGKIQTTYSNGLNLTVKDNNGNDFIFKYPKIISLDNDRNSGTYGHLVVDSNITGAAPLVDQYIPMIKSIEYDSRTDSTNINHNGEIKVNYVSGNNTVTTQSLGDLTYIKNVIIDNSTQQVKTVNNKGVTTDTTTWLNIVKQFYLDEKTGHLFALYNSSYYRPSDSTIGTNGILYKELDENPNNLYTQSQHWVKGSLSQDIAGNTNNWWHDLGIVYEKAGVKIITHYTYTKPAESTLPLDTGEVLNQLNSVYSNGHIGTIDGVDRDGGLVIVEGMKNSDNDTIGKLTGAFYFDYSNDNGGTWRYLGDWDNNSINQATPIYLQDIAGTTVPTENTPNPTFTFVDTLNTTNNKNQIAVIGYYPWEA